MKREIWKQSVNRFNIHNSGCFQWVKSLLNIWTFKSRETKLGLLNVLSEKIIKIKKLGGSLNAVNYPVIKCKYDRKKFSDTSNLGSAYQPIENHLGKIKRELISLTSHQAMLFHLPGPHPIPPGCRSRLSFSEIAPAVCPHCLLRWKSRRNHKRFLSPPCMFHLACWEFFRGM